MVIVDDTIIADRWTLPADSNISDNLYITGVALSNETPVLTSTNTFVPDSGLGDSKDATGLFTSDAFESKELALHSCPHNI